MGDEREYVIGKCGGCGELVRFDVDDEENAAEEIRGQKCPGCGFVFTDPKVMGAEEIEELWGVR